MTEKSEHRDTPLGAVPLDEKGLEAAAWALFLRGGHPPGLFPKFTGTIVDAYQDEARAAISTYLAATAPSPERPAGCESCGGRADLMLPDGSWWCRPCDAAAMRHGLGDGHPTLKAIPCCDCQDDGE